MCRVCRVNLASVHTSSQTFCCRSCRAVGLSGGVGWCRVVSGCRGGVGLVSDDSVGLSSHPSGGLAQRSGSLTALARWSRARRRILPPRRSRPVAAQLVGARVGRISTCATCGETRPTLRTGRALAHLCSCVCGCSSRAVCVGLAPLRGFQCKKLAVGQHHILHTRTAPLLGRSGARLAPVRPPGGWKRGDN